MTIIFNWPLVVLILGFIWAFVAVAGIAAYSNSFKDDESPEE